MTKFFVDGMERVLSTFCEVMLAGVLFSAFRSIGTDFIEWLSWLPIPFILALSSALFALIKVNAARVLFDPTSASLVDPRDITRGSTSACATDSAPMNVDSRIE